MYFLNERHLLPTHLSSTCWSKTADHRRQNRTSERSSDFANETFYFQCLHATGKTADVSLLHFPSFTTFSIVLKFRSTYVFIHICIIRNITWTRSYCGRNLKSRIMPVLSWISCRCGGGQLCCVFKRVSQNEIGLDLAKHEMAKWNIDLLIGVYKTDDIIIADVIVVGISHTSQMTLTRLG
jgi:hypothetical protein